MKLNFVRVEVRCASVCQYAWIHSTGLKRPLEAHTERQGVLVLMRKRDQARITKHGT